MTSTETDLDELKALQREAAVLRSQRQQKSPNAARTEGEEDGAASVEAAVSQPEAGPAADSESLEEVIAASAKRLEDLNIDFNAILKDMEETARERPVLSLVAAFSLGIVIGQLFSRK
ncbi:MAG: hypothetical protein PVJ14_03000 [Chromatiales bacterium]|jgi:hypothetical protein